MATYTVLVFFSWTQCILGYTMFVIRGCNIDKYNNSNELITVISKLYTRLPNLSTFYTAQYSVLPSSLCANL